MIAVARYPDNNVLNQLHLPYAGLSGYSSSTQNYQLAMDHWKEVQQWCTMFLQGPWQCDNTDILFDGVRVRIGALKDLAYFQLKWDCSR